MVRFPYGLYGLTVNLMSTYISEWRGFWRVHLEMWRFYLRMIYHIRTLTHWHTLMTEDISFIFYNTVGIYIIFW